MTLRRDRDVVTLVLLFSGFELLCGLAIGRGSWTIPFAGLAILGLLLVGVRGGLPALVLVAAAALFQTPLFSIGSVPDLQPAEMIIPLLLLTLPLSGPLRLRAHERVGAFSAENLIHGAIVVYAVVIGLNFLRSKYAIVDAVPITRPFYAFLIGIGTYLLVYRGMTRRPDVWQQLFVALFWLSLIVCVLGLVAIALKLPLSLGTQTFSVTTYQETSAVRVGFLDLFGSLGLALTIVGIGRFRLAAGAVFAVALVASGGRTATVGMIVALALYFLLARRWVPIFLAGIAVLVVISFALPQLQQQSQFQRLTNISQQSLTSNERGFFYAASIKAFGRHPLIGTGMGAPATAYATDPSVTQFEEQQLEYGGHATYHSLLKNFGLVGFLPFIAALLVGIGSVARFARRDPACALFFILLVQQAIVLYTSGNGSDPFYFFCLAGAAASTTLYRRMSSPKLSRDEMRNRSDGVLDLEPRFV